MAILTQTRPLTDKIYTTHPNAHPDPRELMATLAQLAGRGRITERDEQLLEYLRELNALSLDQVRRLLWPDAKAVTAYQRLHRLQKHHLVGGARVPRTGMQAWGLAVGKVYTLDVGGRMWLREEVNPRQPARYLRRDQVLHDLLVAEVLVRLTEAVRRRGEGWSLAWAGERAAGFYEKGGDAPLIAPDGLAVVRQQRGDKTAALPLFVELDASREAHGRLSSDWGRKLVGYDRCYAGDWKSHPELSNLPAFPVVAVVTHGAQRLLNLADAILEQRRQPVAYYLVLWEDVFPEGDDMLAAPAWLVVPPDGAIIGRERAQRRPLLPAETKKRAKKAADGGR
jgi:hypothetical protein